MNEASRKSHFWVSFANDYGMVFILLLLMIVLSLLTLDSQNPTGTDAGKQTEAKIINQYGIEASVGIFAGSTPEDQAFVSGAREVLDTAGVKVVASVVGRPSDARRAIEAAMGDGESIDAIAATGDAATWTVYDRFESIDPEARFSPEPYLWPTFATLDNFLSVTNQTAIYAIIAIGMTMVIITAGIDLSVGSLVALASVMTTLFIQNVGGGEDAGIGIMCLGCFGGMVACALAGCFNGAMITRFRIPPFIATLAMMMIARGMARRFAAEESIDVLPDSFNWIGGGTVLGIPNPVILMIILYVIAHWVMSRTIFGRYVYAVGGNAEAARLSGVPVKRVILVVYTLCGALAGLGGIVLSSKLFAGDPKYGVMYELDVIAAVVVGGTSLMGGEGRIFGTLIGAFIIAVIKNGMNLMHVGAPDQQIVLGAVVLAAVFIDTVKRHDGTT